jgi:hypothetical protein
LRQRSGLFRGSELPRWLLLTGLLVAGWGIVLAMVLNPKATPAPTPQPTVEDGPPPKPDPSPELQGIIDGQRVSPRENPGYLLLLDRVRETPPAELARSARRDVLFNQIIEKPWRYRGLPIHVEGTALRILRQDATGSRLFPEGEYYEAYVISADSQNHPWILVFEHAPEGLPIGDDIRRRVSFDGYFFKVLQYLGGRRYEIAPVLIGRLRWIEPPEAAAGAETGWSLSPWWLLALAALLGLGVARWAFAVRRTTRPRGLGYRSAKVFEEELEPEDLDAWLQTQATGEPDDDENEPEPPPRGRRP